MVALRFAEWCPLLEKENLMKRILLIASIAMASNASAVVAYDNTNATTVTLSNNGGAATAGGGTIVVADLLTIDPAFVGWTMSVLTWGVGNTDTTATTARMRVRFWADNAGTPGTLLGGSTFNATSIPAGANAYNADFTSAAIALPSKIWVGFLFDSLATSTPALVAKLNKLGLLYHSGPPAVGSSADSVWASSAAGSNFVNSPAGTVIGSPFGGNPIANAYFKVQAVPEPASMVAVALGLAAVARRRRSK
jgi:hypothetical protein